MLISKDNIINHTKKEPLLMPHEELNLEITNNNTKSVKINNTPNDIDIDFNIQN